MEPEFLVVSGSRLSERFSLGQGEVRIGRAPGSTIRLDESGVAWEHCVIRRSDGQWRLVDQRTGAGTFVNGMRVSDHCLEAGDQISIGSTVLLYREEAAPDATLPQHMLLQACSLLFLFRALAASENEGLREKLEEQVLRLITDLVPCRGGAVLLGRDAAELQAAAKARGFAGDQTAGVTGAAIDNASGTVAVPLYVRASIAGLIVVQFPPEQTSRLQEHCDTLAAVAMLGTIAFETVREVESLNLEKALLLERLGDAQDGIVGDSSALRKLMHMVARVAASETSVLILGESGTGKEMVARAIHRQSPRAAAPFVAINCAAITETLLESELFGHERGAFTGAVAQKKGKLEVAEGGSVFLDEIGELAVPMQAKLLRVLQEREFERVGGTRPIKLDVRLIAATNRDLRDASRNGGFRPDLYYRLNVVSLHMPALRERREDVPLLAAFFANLYGEKVKRHVAGIAPEARACLMRYDWPGNVRELENAIERAVVLGSTEFILPEDLPESILERAETTAATLAAFHDGIRDAKKVLIERAIEQANGNYTEAARLLGVHANHLFRLIRTLNMKPKRERT